MLVISLGLGSTWVAWQIAPADSSAMLTGVAYAQETQPPSEQDESARPTTEGIDAQLARIDKALETQGEVKEFIPSEPVPADIAIPMSSEL